MTSQQQITGPNIGFTLKTSTWVSNSHGLYDYESHNVSAKTYRCHGRNSAYRILRKGIDVSLVSDVIGRNIIVSDPQVQTVARLVALDEAGYSVEPVKYGEDHELRRAYAKATGSEMPSEQSEEEIAITKEELKAWAVVRSLKEGSIPLKEGDYVKLGRLCFKIRQLVLDSDAEREVLGRLMGSETSRAQRKGFGDTREEAPTEPNDGVLSMSTSACRERAQSNLESQIQTRFEWPDELEPHSCADGSSSANGTTDQVNDADDDGFLLQQCDRSSMEHQVAKQSGDDGMPLCRVCLSEEEDAQADPLISPCKCDGSMKWIHLQCLRTWMSGRLNVNNAASSLGGTSCFFWRPLECELCQEPYPTYIECNTLSKNQSSHLSTRRKAVEDPIRRAFRSTIGPTEENVIELFQIPKPALPFLVLESKHAPSGELGFHFISFENKISIQVGRGHEADIRVADISVSRLHAALRYQPDPNLLVDILRECDYGVPVNASENEIRTPFGRTALLADLHRPYVYLEDLKSKFGTLIAVTKPVYLYPRMMISLQIGRTVLTIYVRKPVWSRLLPSCFHVYYRGFMSRRLRRRRQSVEEITSRSADPHDVRLMETYLPVTVLNASAASVNESTPAAVAS